MKRIVAVALLVVAACGQSKTPVQIISGAPAAAAARGSARVSLESIVRLTGEGHTFSTVTRADGVSELGGARRGRMTLTVTTNPSAGRGLSPCEMISQGTIVYVKSREAAGGKHWVKVDIAKVTGIDPSALSSDPSAQLDYLKSVTGTVKVLGHEDIRGVSTTHYQYTLDVNQFMARLPSSSTRQQMQSALRELGITAFPLNTWIDEDGLPRRVSFDWKTTKQGATFDLSTRIDTYDYGTSASISPPGAGDVATSANPMSAFAECFGAPAGSLGGVPQ